MRTLASSAATYRRAVQQLAQADPVFGRAMQRIGPCRLANEIKPMTTTFEALLEAITHQQLSTKAAATIHARVVELAPGLEPVAFLKLEDAVLREAGLSRAKVRAVQDLAQRTCAGEVPSMAALQEMDNMSIIQSLSQIRGIGRWSAEMLLIFRLGRLDVLPAQDLGVQQGFRASFRRSSKPIAAAMEHRGQRWRPYRSVASWYLWRLAEASR